jgi:catechol 2,3-dioxygenase-like lactoylglutathione lyase family enzyme
MFNYAAIGSNRLEEAKPFYDVLCGMAGLEKAFDHPSGGRIYGQPGVTMFGVLAPYDGEPASVGNGTTFGFHVKDRATVDAFHAKALEMGGTCDGLPGPRGGDSSPFYFAYVRDLDGNKICAYNIAGVA